VCEVEVDPATGNVDLVAYSSVNDVGRVVNPTIVRGQLDGGAVQGGSFVQFIQNLAGACGEGSIVEREHPPRASHA
jgi:xanthine dehydrogenase molybdopterin-binding subunit B